MSCEDFSLDIVRGESATFLLTVKDEAGALVDLTAAVAYFRVKQKIDDVAVEIQKTSSVVGEITILPQSGDTLGQFKVFLVPGDSSALPIGKHVYDAWVVLPGGGTYAVVGPEDFRIARGVTELAASPPPAPSSPSFSYLLFSSDSTVDQVVYVDGVNGNDANPGTLPTSALRSMDAVPRKFPSILTGGAKLRVHVAGVGGFGASATAVQEYVANLAFWGGLSLSGAVEIVGADMIRITPTTGPATAAMDSTPAVVVGNRTRLDFTAAAPGWTSGDFAGHFARVRRAGAAVFFHLPIKGNTSNTVTIDATGIVGVILATDTFEIVEPSVRLKGPAEEFNVLTCLGRGTVQPAAASPRVSFRRIGFENGSIFDGSGFHFQECRISGGFFRGTDFGFHCCANRFGGILFAGTTANLTSPVAEAGQINASVGLEWTMAGGSLSFTNPSDGVSPSFGVYTAYRNVGIYDGVLDGLLVKGKAEFYAMAGVAVAVEGHAGVGIFADKDGLVRVNGGSLLSCSGNAGGNLKIEGQSAIDTGTGAGQFEEPPAGINGNWIAPTRSASRITTAA